MAKQERVAAGELPTDGYTMLSAAITHDIQVRGANLQVFLRGANPLDEEARNHASFLEDIAPLGRRAVMVGVRGAF